MKACDCKEPHERRRVVLTGGPGAGNTAVLELIRQSFCVHVKVLPGAAGIVFGAGFSAQGPHRAPSDGTESDFLCPARARGRCGL
jgi:hypothetical protein